MKFWGVQSISLFSWGLSFLSSECFCSSCSFNYKPFHLSNQNIRSLCVAQNHRTDYQMLYYLPFINYISQQINSSQHFKCIDIYPASKVCISTMINTSNHQQRYTAIDMNLLRRSNMKYLFSNLCHVLDPK